ncbi:hypothetical protein SAMN05421761_10199 [Belliella pelovolcani]|uniref:Uncharacterized protein n=1 Tax=Belliella pelovolcani TaxID=529505 RepID=A0A1N7JKH5_9BACT|nr:hypothetical protein SAMN05421761_10199 [Belliella pelovolcani]
MNSLIKSTKERKKERKKQEFSWNYCLKLQVITKKAPDFSEAFIFWKNGLINLLQFLQLLQRFLLLLLQHLRSPLQ